MVYKVQIETASNGWIVHLMDAAPGASVDHVESKMIFSEWPKLINAVACWLGPDSGGGPQNL